MSSASTRQPEPVHRQLGLTDDELAAIVELLGRDPTELELAMYAVMWSEHCSYKSSKRYLGRFPTEAPWVLVGPGEGAGVIDVGDGLAVAIRIESHNHPSAVEPYQGAATGVGGIIRDVFSMGARPIALMDPLRFGPLDDARTRYLLEGVVAGISGYGNAVGVPTVGGEVVFDECYRDNPLVNVLCLGVLPVDRLVLAKAEGVGNVAVLLGSATGRDGIGGASVLASAGFSEGDEAKRPSVQVGDPFEEKRLIEACLELLDAGLAVGRPGPRRRRHLGRDVGDRGEHRVGDGRRSGAGTQARAGHERRRGDDVGEPGADARHRHAGEPRAGARAVPAVGDPSVGRRAGHRHRALPRVRRLVRRGGRAWRQPAAPRGDNPPVVSSDVSPIVDVPVASLGDGPVYDRPATAPSERAALHADDPAPALAHEFPSGTDLSGELLALLASPNIADKSWVFRQYDHQLFLNTVVAPGGDAAVLRLKGTARALALTTDGKARFCALDPYTGARLTVIEAARNLACVGAVPKALVNCLNFGNPEHPEVMWQFAEVVDGMSDACRALGIPVVGGNVSFYNESRGRDIDPTPVIGVVGLVERLTSVPPPAELDEGDALVVFGHTAPELGGSEWAGLHDRRGGTPPAADLDVAGQLHDFVRELVARRDGARRARRLRRGAGGRPRRDGGHRRVRVPGRVAVRAGPGTGLVLGVGVPRGRRRRSRRCRRPGRAGPGRQRPRPAPRHRRRRPPRGRRCLLRRPHQCHPRLARRPPRRPRPPDARPVASGGNRPRGLGVDLGVPGRLNR